MSILDILKMSDTLSKPIEAIGNAIDKTTTSDDERNQAKLEFEKLIVQVALAQIDLNKTEAQSESFIKSNWRPAIGWVCATSIALYFIPQFLAASALWVYFCIHKASIIPYPIDPHSVIELTGAVLGIYGTQRTIEAIQSKR